MKWHRVVASTLHSWYHLTHSMETWVDLFWFALIDITLFGFISSFLVSSESQARFLVLGIVMWEVVRVGQYTVTVGMLWEIWSKSFSSLFVSPLTIWEFITGQAISGLFKSLAVMTIVSAIAYFLFSFDITALGIVALPIYFTVLFAFSIAAGIFILSLIVRFGTDIQSLAWGLIYLVQPVSAIFYPVGVLPAFLRPLAYASPITYVMESAPSQVSGFGILWHYLAIGLCLALFYLIAGIWNMNRLLVWSKTTGSFARMSN